MHITLLTLPTPHGRWVPAALGFRLDRNWSCAPKLREAVREPGPGPAPAFTQPPFHLAALGQSQVTVLCLVPCQGRCTPESQPRGSWWAGPHESLRLGEGGTLGAERGHWQLDVHAGFPCKRQEQGLSPGLTILSPAHDPPVWERGPRRCLEVLSLASEGFASVGEAQDLKQARATCASWGAV